MKKDVFITGFSKLKLRKTKIEFKQSWKTLYVGLCIFVSFALFLMGIVKFFEQELGFVLLLLLAVVFILIARCFRCCTIDLSKMVVSKKIMIWKAKVYQFRSQDIASDKFLLDCYEGYKGKDRVTFFVLRQEDYRVVDFDSSDQALDFYRIIEKYNGPIRLIKSDSILNWEKLVRERKR